jgi:hypothetical protein
MSAALRLKCDMRLEDSGRTVRLRYLRHGVRGHDDGRLSPEQPAETAVCMYAQRHGGQQGDGLENVP